MEDTSLFSFRSVPDPFPVYTNGTRIAMFFAINSMLIVKRMYYDVGDRWDGKGSRPGSGGTAGPEERRKTGLQENGWQSRKEDAE